MLEFHNIVKSYRQGELETHALKGVSGSIAEGEMVALCGPSGSGKSTLLNILGLLDQQYQGNVALGGKSLPQAPAVAAAVRRGRMGFIFQRFNLIPVMSALENVAYPLRLNGYSPAEQTKLATEMLARVGLEAFVHHRPDHLSGGQQQRVAIARALVHSPELVIADEPTASLDSKTATNVIEIMKQLGHERGSAFVIATHDPRMANRCDRVIELSDGLLTEKELLSWVS